jgi:parallel beta-helix repeat protein
VHILNANIRGYKIAIRARGTRNLELTGDDVSYNWKPRLFSLVEHESLVDWLSFHHNEKGEWLRYGAGIYLDSIDGGTLKGNRCVQGMNALLLTRSDRLRITENNFSFNSGLGIGLYRSDSNSITHNLLDYNVRGYSHRFYRRGQDSADLLVYEQSSNNIVAYNSATHGGDGFFLWAGQSTMDSGKGGANDNLLYRNDFSFAPANGIEVTFSRNTIVANRLEGNDYGIWGGYSFGSKIAGNRFVRNRVGIAIEHGQENTIVANSFNGDSTCVTLWAAPIEPSDWGYPKHRDTRSRDYRMTDNLFAEARYGVKARNTSGIFLDANRWSDVDTAAIFRDTAVVRTDRNAGKNSTDRSEPKLPAAYASIAAARDFSGDSIPQSPLARSDRSAIIVDEWGPYDYQSPKLWPADSSHAVPLRLKTLGPPGKWNVVGRNGIAKLSATSGTIGDVISVTPGRDSTGDWQLALEYRGGPTVSPRGKRLPGGTPYGFSYQRFEPLIDWNVRFFAWNDSSDPRTRADAFRTLLNSSPILSRRIARLDFEWYRPELPELPQERFAFEATGSVTLAEGTYSLRTISDDGVRVWVDGRLLIDNWSQHGSVPDYNAIGGGKHELRVQYFQVDGWVEFRLDILRGYQRSTGSPM